MITDVSWTLVKTQVLTILSKVMLTTFNLNYFKEFELRKIAWCDNKHGCEINLVLLGGDLYNTMCASIFLQSLKN